MTNSGPTVLSPPDFVLTIVEVFAHLEQQHLLDSWRVLDHQLLVSLDGTQYFSSKALHCQNCLTRQLSNGHTLYYHTAITPVIVCPGHSQVIALAPEYIMPQDGHAQQDCEQTAGKRWITHHATTLVPHHVTLLGDDLYSKEPLCSLALHHGFNFILVCKPDSHPKFYERLAFWQAQGAIAQYEQRHRKGRLTEVVSYRFINNVLLQDGKPALAVNWVEMTGVNAKTGEHLYYNTFITNHRLSGANVAQVAQAGRGRWKIENENNNVLKTKGYHLEHNFGHGKQYLSATMLSLNLLAFLFHTVLEWSDETYALLRQVLARRQTFCEDMRALTRYMVFESWHHLMDFMLKGLKLESKLALKLRPNLFFSSKRRHTIFDCDWIQTCALPILARALLRGAPQRVGAQGRGLGARAAAREERADEAGQQVAAPTGGESRITARHYVDRAAQIGDRKSAV